MSDFVKFAQSYGLIIDHYIDDGQWHRCTTIDHPHKRNGAYKFCGDHGFVQNHATMEKVELWKTDKPINMDEWKLRARQAEKKRAQESAAAAKKAAWMFSQSEAKHHDYFYLKGFPDHVCNVLDIDGKQMALLPMRVDDKLTSLQMIYFEDMRWHKKFLKYGVTKGAVFRLGKGKPILCEGFATGLSIAKALRLAKLQYQVVICYSAHNMLYMAQQCKPVLVVADNDESGTGARIAAQIGVKTWISEKVGNDFNDDHLSRGDFAMMQDIRKILMEK